MTHPLHDVATGPRPPDELNAFIEIPRGSRNKYELDKETGLLRLDRLLYSSVHYPGDYGFLPRTLADDGHPLDVLVLTTEPTFPGCLVEWIGATEDGSLSDLPSHYLDEVQHFFDVYKELEGVTVTTEGWEDVDAARALVLRCIEQYPGR